jgi:bacterioferritin
VLFHTFKQGSGWRGAFVFSVFKSIPRQIRVAFLKKICLSLSSCSLIRLRNITKPFYLVFAVTMNEAIHQDTTQILNAILEAELTGVMRYTQYSLSLHSSSQSDMIQFLQEQATESLQHAQQVGALLTQYCDRPSLNIAALEALTDASPDRILQKSIQHETMALGLYRDLLEAAEHHDELEAFARTMIEEEEEHSAELRKMFTHLQREKTPC